MIFIGRLQFVGFHCIQPNLRPVVNFYNLMRYYIPGKNAPFI
uniref:Uncharacterized protein n=1 Tax=Methylophaga nitratireducenticrescens TaxID=754476 RepID=I1XM60_METNJ